MSRKYSLYTSKEIKPSGWLRRQLEIQAEGLSGNLDKVWPDIRDSAWIGGKCEGWERVPYWLDGFIPLAYLLENEDMIGRVKKYMNAIMANQRPDGWICPCEENQRAEYDTWAVILISKVLVVYYDCSGDEKALKAVYDLLKNYYQLLSKGEIKLFNWGKARWFEAFIALRRIYEIHPEDWMKDLGRILREQGLDYYAEREKWVRPLNKWTYETHIVNLGMMLKCDAVSCDILGTEYSKMTDEMYSILYRYNGRPVGIFSGDECLSGTRPIQGTELCSVAELMYSYELLYAYTGDKKWAERLELAAFNAFPATCSDDMWTHQYDQMSNQIACQRFPGKSLFRTNGKESHLFGLEPNFGCCTANMNQAWPKLALAAYMHDRYGVIASVPVPAVLQTKIKGINTRIACDTEYPFKNTLKYTINTDSPVFFSFRVRIPSCAVHVMLNGEPKASGGMVTVKQVFQGETVICISFDTLPELVRERSSLYSLKCGSLVFSLPIEADWIREEYTKNDVERKYPYCDYELVPRSDWNYGFAATDCFEIERHDVSDVPFSAAHPAVTIRAKMAQIDWGLEDGYETVCAGLPHHTKPLGEIEEKLLVPYGCAKLRMTEMPVVKKR